MIESDKWYDLQCLPEPVTGEQLSALLDMVEHSGWGVYMKMRDIQARASGCVALNLSLPLETQQEYRALWKAQGMDLSFKHLLKEEAKGAVGVTRDNLGISPDINEAPVPTLEEFNKAVKQKPRQ